MSKSKSFKIDEKSLEPMADFFNTRVEDYEQYMLKEGLIQVYSRFAGLIPAGAENILDLGCGTGLELDEIFRFFPHISVTGIDMAAVMLDKLKKKYPDKDMTLTFADYFQTDLGNSLYDTAVSANTMHHFTRESKVSLYRKIREALKPGGVYLECDYIADDQAQADGFYAEYFRIRREQNIPDGEFYHYDIPFTVETQLELLKQAGYSSVELVFRYRGGAVMRAVK